MSAKTIKLPKGFWTVFAQDSAEREIFRPLKDDLATVDQLRDLLSDAEYYSGRWGPDMIWPGLKRSAKATAAKTRALLTEHGAA